MSDDINLFAENTLAELNKIEQDMLKAEGKEQIKVVRVLMYEGPRDWVEQTLARSLSGSMVLNRVKTQSITEVYRGEIGPGEWPNGPGAGKMGYPSDLD